MTRRSTARPRQPVRIEAAGSIDEEALLISKQTSLTALRIVLGAVLAMLSTLTLFRAGSDLHHEHLGLAVRALAIAEIAGACLLLVPRTIRIGAVVLLLVFAAGAAIHFLHGEWNIGPLVIYAAATQVFLVPGPTGAKA
jgi:hypothetical protein